MRSDKHQLSPGPQGDRGREAPAPGKRAALRKLRLLLVPAAMAITLDLLTKAWALSALSPYARRSVAFFFNLVLVTNQGAAFSLLAADGPGQGLKMALLALAAMVPLAWFYRQARPSDRALLTGLGLILGGGAGNVHDRLRYGAVVDFLDLHLGEAHWPAFNLADVSVCLGAGLLALTVLFGRGPFGPKAKEADSARDEERAKAGQSGKPLGKSLEDKP